MGNKTLMARICALELMEVRGWPTAEQEQTIAHAMQIGSRLLVFVEPGDTVWMAGDGEPPWKTRHLPHIVPDDTAQAEIDGLSPQPVEAYRSSDADRLDLFL